MYPMLCNVSWKYYTWGLQERSKSEGLTVVFDDKLGDAQCSISSHLHRPKSSVGKNQAAAAPLFDLAVGRRLEKLGNPAKCRKQIEWNTEDTLQISKR